MLGIFYIMDKQISHAKYLKGEISIPGDKSISHRAVMFSAIAEGESTIQGFLDAADPRSTIECFRNLGIHIQKNTKNEICIKGKGLYGLKKPSKTLDAGNSGTTIRLIAGILSGQTFSTTISGDEYLIKRPMKRIIDPLTLMGVKFESAQNGTAPLTIHPPKKLQAITYELPIASAQVKSAVLLAGLYADGITEVIENEPSRNHTENMLGLESSIRNGKTIISVDGGKKVFAKEFFIPGDPSSAAFFVVAALLIPHSEVLIKNVSLNPSRTGFLNILIKMGGDIQIENKRENGGEPIGDLAVRSSQLKNIEIISGDIIPNIIDEIPILAVAAAFSENQFEIRGAADLRNKETDRIHAVCSNLKKMGIDVEEFQDGFAFLPKKNLLSNRFESFGDHRIAMAFGIASLALQGESTVRGVECADISFPNFWQILDELQK